MDAVYLYCGWEADDFYTEVCVDAHLYTAISNMFFPNDVSRDWSGISVEQLEHARLSYWVAKGNPQHSFDHWKLLLRHLLSRYPSLVNEWKHKYFGNCVPAVPASTAPSIKASGPIVATLALSTSQMHSSLHSTQHSSGEKRGRSTTTYVDRARAITSEFTPPQQPPKKRPALGLSKSGSLPALFATAAQDGGTNKTLRHFPENCVVVLHVTDAMKLSYRLHDVLITTDMQFTKLIREMCDRYYHLVRTQFLCEHEATDVDCSNCESCSAAMQCQRHVDPHLGRCSILHCTQCLYEIQALLLKKRTECADAARQADADAAVEAVREKNRATLQQSIQEKKILSRQYIDQLGLSVEAHTTLEAIPALLDYLAKLEYKIVDGISTVAPPLNRNAAKRYNKFIKKLSTWTYAGRPIFKPIGDRAVLCTLCESDADGASRKVVQYDTKRSCRKSNWKRHALQHFDKCATVHRSRYRGDIFEGVDTCVIGGAESKKEDSEESENSEEEEEHIDNISLEEECEQMDKVTRETVLAAVDHATRQGREAEVELSRMQSQLHDTATAVDPGMLDFDTRM